MNEKEITAVPATDRLLKWPDIPWDDLYTISSWRQKPRRKEKYYSPIIALDTETSKYDSEILFITDWTLTIEDFGCIYGNRAADLIDCLRSLVETIQTGTANRAIIYVHNYSYDYMFLRNHLFAAFGEPVGSLATKPHKYVTMRFENGLEFRDSYILTGRNLEKFAADMGTAIQKQVGSWDYKKFRTPGSVRTPEEIKYVCADTIALVQGLREFFRQHKCNTATVELTQTGFVRKAGLQASRKDKEWRRTFRKSALDLEQYNQLEFAFHGGYTHANRYHIGEIIRNVTSYDFTSSYPARMLYDKFPMSKFIPYRGADINSVLEMSDTFAFCGNALFIGIEVDRQCPMPPIAKHKCKILRDPIIDNGRVVSAEMLVVPFTDPDLEAIAKYYTWEYCELQSVMYAEKEYLPDWFCGLIMELFKNKTTLKGVDPVLYMLSKGMLNSMYGMSVQKIIRDDITEDFESMEWLVDRTRNDPEKGAEKLKKFYDNRSKFLPYQWGVWVTAYAQRELFKLGECCGLWIYSDTDSVKGCQFDMDALNKYNDSVREISRARGYGTIEYNGKTYTIGVAEFDGNYSEFVTLGSKRYCYRENGELHITVAGVPKIGVAELQDDIKNFRKDMVFKETHKQAATYIYVDWIHQIMVNGETIEYGCAVRLDDVEYTLDQTLQFNPVTGLPYSEFQYI